MISAKTVIFHLVEYLSLSLKRQKMTENLSINGYTLSLIHGCTNRSNLEMEPKYLMKSDIRLNPIILRTKNDKRIL